jgi:hypothetical protein
MKHVSGETRDKTCFNEMNRFKAMELRQESISAHAVVLRALGAAGAELMREDPTAWKGRLLELTKIDWRKKNTEWEKVCIIANSVASNRQARLATRQTTARTFSDKRRTAWRPDPF